MSSRDGRKVSSQSLELPKEVVEVALLSYRSVGIGVFGVVMRYVGMPLEKIALFINSPQVSGKDQFRKAVKLTFEEGMLAPYRVVGPSSIVAWFLQYSVMGLAFQFFDHSLSSMMGVKPVYYGHELMEPADQSSHSLSYNVKSTVKTIMAPILAASLESQVSNRAEAQRYFGRSKFFAVEARLNLNPIARAAGPAYLASAARNVVMCNTSFLLTPVTYKQLFPQEYKSQSTLFWYGLGMNVFVGNVVAITQQALWGRTLSYAAENGQIKYSNIVREGFANEGMAAFFTTPKWFARVLMNAPAQGLLPWFYNEILPIGEPTLLSIVWTTFYTPMLKKKTQ